MRRFVALTVVITAALIVPGRSSEARNKLPPNVQKVDIDQKLDAQVPLDLSFRDEQGRPVRLGDFIGKRPVVLTLNYYECPMLCSLELENLVKTLNLLPFTPAEDYEIVTVSFDPGETPEMAAAEKKERLADLDKPNGARAWHFLTGEKEAIERLTRAVGFSYEYDAERDEYAHGAGLVVLTPEGRISRYLYGMEVLPRDLRLALVEASKNEIGTVTEQILLLCYHYDPQTGKYGAIAMNSVRAGGVVTLLGLGGLLAVLWRRERRRRSD